MDGLVGRLFREFAITLATAIGISLVISLTLTPMMCAYLLKKRSSNIKAKHRGFGRVLLRLQESYAAALNWVLNHRRSVLAVLFATIGLNVYLYITVPKTFFPEQDTGRIMGFVRADQSISFQSMKEKMTRFMQQVKDDPATDNVTGFTGGSRVNSGFMYISLKPLANALKARLK